MDNTFPKIFEFYEFIWNVYNSNSIDGFVFYLATLLSGICECPSNIKQRGKERKLRGRISVTHILCLCGPRDHSIWVLSFSGNDPIKYFALERNIAPDQKWKKKGFIFAYPKWYHFEIHNNFVFWFMWQVKADTSQYDVYIFTQETSTS